VVSAETSEKLRVALRRRWGDPIKRFWSRVDKSAGPDGCWFWTASRGHGGYGAVWWNGCMTSAHRVAYRVAVGEIPSGMCVLHKCDNPLCVNPEHLFFGTQQDNLSDMTSKGRQAVGASVVTRRGEECNFSKLTAPQVQEIRRLDSSGVSSADISSKFGISRKYIWRIVSKKSWTHVP